MKHPPNEKSESPAKVNAYKKDLFEVQKPEENFLERSNDFMVEKLQTLVSAFRERTERMREKLVQAPPTPCKFTILHNRIGGYTESSNAIRVHMCPAPPPERAEPGSPSLDSLFHVDNDEGEDIPPKRCCWGRLPAMPAVFDPQSKFYISWLFLVTLCFLYNSWGLLLRTVFPYQTPHNLQYLLAVDYFCDLVYILDVLAFKTRTQYLEDGFWVADPKKTRRHYFKKIMFKLLLRCRLYLVKRSVTSSFHGPLQFREQEKVTGGQSGEYGGCGIISVLFLAKKSRTSNDV
ncbi:CNGB1 [Cordylochernes scorpioides]|uniref:CNGB1 n=1 Tax=Cordylochernes scorpioides TaxID=51811 RepID=A0ABY6KCV1_9ARAC|nr:CNGB1 [Cordylochernes scorpioides]